MPTLTRPNSPVSSPAPARIPPPPQNVSPRDNPETWDYGFNRNISLPQSPPVGAGILAITLFLLIVFYSNILLAHVSLRTIGIAVTLSTFGLMGLVILLLFLF